MKIPPPTIYLNDDYLDTEKYPIQRKIIEDFETARGRALPKGKVGVYIADKSEKKLDRKGWEYIEYSNLLETLHKEDCIDYMIVTDLTSKLHHFNTPNKIEIEKDTYTHIAIWVSKKLSYGGIMSTEFTKVGKDYKDFRFIRELTLTLRMEGLLCVILEKSGTYILYCSKDVNYNQN